MKGKGEPLVSLAEEIKKEQKRLIVLVQKKGCRLNDPEVYRQSCLIDTMIVEFMKSGNTKLDQ